MTLRIAVPDGPLKAPSLDLLSEIGELDAALIVLPAADILSYVASGAADAGLVRHDRLLEHDPGLCELLDLRFGRGRLVHAAAPWAGERVERLGRLRIATRHPHLTRAHFSGRGIDVEVVVIGGALDRAAADGVVDGVVALLDAQPDGAHDPVAGLEVVATLVETSVRLVSGRAARVLKQAELGALVVGLRDRLDDGGPS